MTELQCLPPVALGPELLEWKQFAALALGNSR